MRDVAELAGVSLMTVSRVLNGERGVRAQTRARVSAAMNCLGYRPNAAARALVAHRSRRIGVVTGEGWPLTGMAALTVVDEIARAHGDQLNVVTPRSASASELRAAVDDLARQGVDGVVLIAADQRAVGEAAGYVRLPIVAVGASVGPGMAAVTVDHVHGARLATEHLLGLGHATVWHVSGPSGLSRTSDQVSGWRSALTAAGAEIPPVLTHGLTPRDGYQAGTLLARIPQVSAVFAAGDLVALGLLRAFAEHGRHVPDDISVVGFGDLPNSDFYHPPR